MKLLNDIQSEPKKAFQTYTIQHGIDRLRVKVPLTAAREFENQVNEAISSGASGPQLLKLVVSFGGSELKG